MSRRISLEEYGVIAPDTVQQASCTGVIEVDAEFCFYAEMVLESDHDYYYVYIVPETNWSNEPKATERYLKAVTYAEEYGCRVCYDLDDANWCVYNQISGCNTRFAFWEDKDGTIHGNDF